MEASGNERQGIDDHPVALTVTVDNGGRRGSEKVSESEAKQSRNTQTGGR